MSDTPRHMSEGGGEDRDMARYTVTVKQASQMFDEANVPRSPRSIQRFCKRGHLDCYLFDREKDVTYKIDPESIERRIEELIQIEHMNRSQPVAFDRADARSDALEPDTARRNVNEEAALAAEMELKELRDKVRILEMENGKALRDKDIAEYVRDELEKRYAKEAAQLNARMDKVVDRLGDSQYKLGKAEAQLLALGSGDATEQSHEKSTPSPEQTTLEDVMEDAKPPLESND